MDYIYGIKQNEHIMTHTIQNTQILKFGKFKGQRFCDAPEWYRNWLVEQKWFKPAKTERPLHTQSLNGWDGQSRSGQAIYDAIFEFEMTMDDAIYTVNNWMEFSEEELDAAYAVIQKYK